MTPPPTLQDLIEIVQRDAAGQRPLEQLAAAATTAAELSETTDALLSHFVDRSRRNGHSWSEISAALGVTKQAAHKRFSSPSFDRFTPRARSILDHAASRARSLGHPYIGTEHLLLAQFDEPESIAARVLTELGATDDAVEHAVLALVPRGSVVPVNHEVVLTPRASATIAAAVGQALELGHNYVGTEHMLLALYSDADGFAAQVLVQLGIERSQVRDKVIEALSGFRSSF